MGDVTPITPSREPYVDAEEVAKHIGVSKATVTRLAHAGKIPARSIGMGRRSLWRFRLSEIDAWMKSGGGEQTA